MVDIPEDENPQTWLAHNERSFGPSVGEPERTDGRGRFEPSEQRVLDDEPDEDALTHSNPRVGWRHQPPG